MGEGATACSGQQAPGTAALDLGELNGVRQVAGRIHSKLAAAIVTGQNWP